MHFIASFVIGNVPIRSTINHSNPISNPNPRFTVWSISFRNLEAIKRPLALKYPHKNVS